MNFADVKNDVAFRKIFGNEHKTEVLVSFLNAVLDLPYYDRIHEVTILNPFLLPRLKGEKASIIDVRATDIQGRQFIIEMQVADKKGFEKRVQYYTSRDYSMQIVSGEDYLLLRATYFVGILDFGIGQGKEYLSKHYTVEEETGDCLLSDIQFRFIQLTKFKKNENELQTMVDKWTYFIKNAKNLNEIPDNVDDEGLKAAYIEADRHRWKKEEVIAYDNAAIKIQDDRGVLELAEERALERGMKRGMEKGMEKGREEERAKAEAEKEQTILSLHKLGLPTESIATAVNKSLEEVLQILAKSS